MTKHLIITADDYGMVESVNAAIEECLAAGALRATCVMVNMPCHAPAAELRQRFPGVSVGVHWTITQGRPALPPADVPSLVDADGAFLSFAQLRRRLLRGQVRMRDIRAELRAQHRRFAALAGPPDFWNTHEGIHVSPQIFQTCVALASELGIPAMRSHRRITVPYGQSARRYMLRHPLYWLKGRIVALWSAWAERRGMRMPDGTVTIPGFRAGKAAIEDVLGRLPWPRLPRAAEFIIHPATRVHPELFGSMTDARVREYQVFRDPSLVARLASQGVQTVGFEVLNGR